MKLPLSLLAVISAFLPVPTRAGYVCNAPPPSGNLGKLEEAPSTDILFLLDTSISMCPLLDHWIYGLQKLVKQMKASPFPNPRYALVTYGGNPRIRLSFTSDIQRLNEALSIIDCDGLGQEASMEAIRRALPPFRGTDMMKDCIFPDDKTCSLDWKAGASKVILLGTDEDSDLPTKNSYFASYQNSSVTLYDSYRHRLPEANKKLSCNTHVNDWEPSWGPVTLDTLECEVDPQYTFFRSTNKDFRLTQPFLLEIGMTADTLIANGVYLWTFLAPGAGTSEWEGVLPVSSYNQNSNYWWSRVGNNCETDPPRDNFTILDIQIGCPGMETKKNSKYDEPGTLKNLIQGGLSTSLQSVMLAYGGKMRVVDMGPFLGNYYANRGTVLDSSAYDDFFKISNEDGLSGDGSYSDEPTSKIDSDVVKPFFSDFQQEITSLQKHCTNVVPSRTIDINKPITGTMTSTNDPDAGGRGGRGGTGTSGGNTSTPPTSSTPGPIEQPQGPSDSVNMPPVPVMIGIIAACVAGLLLIGLGAILYRRRKLRAEPEIFRSAPPEAIRPPPAANPLYQRQGQTQYSENPLYHARHGDGAFSYAS
jgi:hypothetical protein